MARHSIPWIDLGLAIAVLLGVSWHTATVTAKEFVIRQVTNFANPGSSARPNPIAVLDGSLIFMGRENGQEGYYRTDGTNVEPIINPNGAGHPISEVVQLGNELFFSADGVDGRELFATDSHSIRQVADLAPGSLDSNPLYLKVVGNHLFFHGITDDPSTGTGAPLKFFHSDGTTIEQFPISNHEPTFSSAIVNDALIFGGNSSLPYATNGETVQQLSTLPLVVDPFRPSIVRAGDSVFLHAVDGVNRGLYRTDGSNFELVSTVASLVPNPRFVSMFPLNSSLHIAIHDSAADQLVIFRTNGETPVEVTRWGVPDDVSFSTLKNYDPVFSTESKAYFSFGDVFDNNLYQFDGSNLELISEIELNSNWRFYEVGGRTLISVEKPGSTSDFYELLADGLNRIGPAIRSVIDFDGELFGADITKSLGSTALTPQLMRMENGQFVPFGDMPIGSSNFIEFNGQLYFGSRQVSTSNATAQLFAIVPVPEPTSLILLLGMCIGVSSYRHPQLQISRRR